MKPPSLHAVLRILALIIVLPTLAMLWVNGARDGVGTLYFLWPDIVVCLVLLIAAARGGRDMLLVAYALAAGVFMTATLGALWTQGLAATPPGAALGAVVCAVVLGSLLLRARTPHP